MKRNLCFLFGLLFIFFNSYARQTLYVAPNGSASNSGSSISAPTTLQNAIATVGAGGTIYMRGRHLQYHRNYRDRRIQQRQLRRHQKDLRL